MWIGAIRLVVLTKALPGAGTDNLVVATVLRDGFPLRRLKLDYPDKDDLEEGAIGIYDYIGAEKLPRVHDRTPPLPDGIGRYPMPYPGYGFEFSNGLAGHFAIRLEIAGWDTWIKDHVDLYVREVRQRATSFDTLDWLLDEHWGYVAGWGRDAALSWNFLEGVGTWTMVL